MDVHPAALPEAKLLDDCRVTATRRGGPGGQHRNKVSSAIVIVHEPTGAMGQASERRDQAQNARIALRRLRINLALSVRLPGTDEEGKLLKPLAAWSPYIKDRRLAISPANGDFPALLAQALDWTAATGWRVDPVAAHLGVTNSQLAKFIQKQPAAWQYLNRQRVAAGLRQLGI